jgi:hypothetical protein
MVGQWFGSVAGTNSGIVTFNFETDSTDVNGMLGGRVMFKDDSTTNVNFYCIIKFKIAGEKIVGILYDFFFYDYNNHLLMSYKDFKAVYPASNIPREGTLEGTLKDNIISGIWKTDIGTQGKFSVIKTEVGVKKIVDYSKTWDEFKKWIVENDKGDEGTIYRGQRNSGHRLRTTFHRSGRNDIIRYAQQDVITLAHHINAVSNYKYDLFKKDDYYAILNLAQHHGFPTPLLDWTESPYVAAYFAYKDVDKLEKDGQVRIYILNASAWRIRCRKVDSLLDPIPSVTISILPAINNNRAIPQQSVSTLSNIDDIEGFIALYETLFKEKYLIRIDLPVTDRNRAMKELQTMGITAASLFPGFDGICNYLRERYF